MTGCKHVPLSGTPCDDGDTCTVDDKCQAGLCKSGPPLACEDGNPCTDDTCDSATGCKHAWNSAPCSDENVCTTGDHCKSGWCAAGGALSCDDNNVCTDDGCDPATGCVNSANVAPCDDGDVCTLGDKCSGTKCVAGAGALSCDDGNVCTLDVCEPKKGCGHPAAESACDDGNLCTEGDACSGGACAPGEPVGCDDSNVCTIDYCHPLAGCLHSAVSGECEDGDVCTLGDKCVDGQCVTGPGVTSCDDANECTADECDPALGCSSVPTDGPCEEGDVCTTGDVCTQGGCVAGTGVLNCDDDNVCTDDSCHPAAGCIGTPVVGQCEDSDLCTLGDECEGGECVGGQSSPDCDDENVCTDDSCDPASGCVNDPNSALCDDGDVCTAGDVCELGECVPGNGPNCDDGDACTDDGCDSKGKCVHVASFSSAACVDWKASYPVSCFTGYSPAMASDGTIWALATATDCNGPDSANNDRAVGTNSVTGGQVGLFTVASPNSQPIWRQNRITLSTDWIHNALCGGCQVGYNLPSGAVAWTGGQGPHARGGISMNPSDGVSYTAYGSIIALSFNGATVWSVSGNSGHGAGSWIMGNGNVVGCGGGGGCRMVTPSGSSVWQQGLGCSYPQLMTDSQSRVVASCYDSGVRVFTAQGSLVWTQDPSASLNGTIVDSDDSILAGTNDGRLVRLAASNGAMSDVGTPCEGATFTPWLLASDGWVYGACNNKKAVGVSKDGQHLWEATSDSAIAWVAPSSDGRLLVATGAAIHRFAHSGITLASTPWPTLDGDAARTRCGKK